MPDGAIVIPDTAVAPKDYTLSGAQEIALKTVRAVIDGSGAASAFLPTLQLLDPNGHVMWEGATSDTVAAGGSADVSWFPGLGGGLGSGTTNAEWFRVTRTSDQTMFAGEHNSVVWTSLKSSDSSLFSLTTDIRANDSVQVSRQGVLIFSTVLTPWDLDPNYPVQVFCQSVGQGVFGTASRNPENTANSLSMVGPVSLFLPRDYGFILPNFVPYSVQSFYSNFDVANRTLKQAEMAGLWWPTGALFV